MIKTQDVPTALREFNAVFNSLIYRHEVSRIFSDFLSIVVATMAHGTQEKQYFEVINRYNKEELENFSRLFGELLVFYNKNIDDKNWCDPLGTYYEILAGNYKRAALGQFFTPKALCDLMAQLTLKKDQFGKEINEPACGSGRAVLAAHTFAKGNRYVCQDRDLICCQMTAINLAFHKVDAVVYCMDTLANSKPSHTFVINHKYYHNKTISILQP